MAAATPSSTSRYHVLVEFAHKHLDFQMAELEAVLDMNGIQFGANEGCEMVPLPNQQAKEESSTVAQRPFVILSLPSDSKFVPHNNNTKNKNGDYNDIGTILLSRCTLVRSVIEIWGHGTSLTECAAATQEWKDHNTLGQSIFQQHAAISSSWKITIHTLGSKYTREEQEAMRAQFSFLQFPGPVLMNEPTSEYVLIREVELDNMGSPLYPRHSKGRVIIPENDARPPLAYYFGRALGGCRKVKGRGNVQEYSLKKRTYLGPTSMDAELSFIMTNLGQVQHGSFVLDPFVGTGSILLSCALRGAYCMGTDIDIRILRGRSQEENIWTNFQQFDLPRPELIRSDNAIYHRHFLTDTPMYDAIICDPPYGIRAGARKSGSRKENPRPVLEENRHDHIAQTKPYAVSDVMSDLLDVAARTLVMGGRLVYIIPSFQEFDEESDLPRHTCLETVHICYQPLSAELGRRMVAMKKIAEYDPSKREEYRSNIWKNGPESAEKCANIRDKIIEAAKKKPGYEERAAIRKQKRKQHKEAKKKAKREATTNES